MDLTIGCTAIDFPLLRGFRPAHEPGVRDNHASSTRHDIWVVNSGANSITVNWCQMTINRNFRQTPMSGIACTGNE